MGYLEFGNGKKGVLAYTSASSGVVWKFSWSVATPIFLYLCGYPQKNFLIPVYLCYPLCRKYFYREILSTERNTFFLQKAFKYMVAFSLAFVYQELSTLGMWWFQKYLDLNFGYVELSPFFWLLTQEIRKWQATPGQDWKSLQIWGFL